MELSIFLAKLFGLYFLIVAAIWALRKNQFEAGVRDIIASPGVFSFTGALQILIGLAIAISHSVWELNWRGLITLLGYFAIVQGIARLALPHEFRGFILGSIERGQWIYIAILGLLGAVLTYHGFGFN